MFSSPELFRITTGHLKKCVIVDSKRFRSDDTLVETAMDSSFDVVEEN
jgi:hypothetical protein